MIFPTIHINGTSCQELMEMNRKASYAVKIAIKALEQAWPNGRDYYPQGVDVIKSAISEHEARIIVMLKVVSELDIISDSIQMQMDERARMKAR